MATQTVTVSRAPVRGSTNTTGAPAAIDYSLTDIDLLEAPEPAPDAAATPGAEAATNDGAHGQGIDAAQDSPHAAGAKPRLAEFERAFELPEIGPKLREMCERDAEYREVFPTVADARAVREIFSTPEAARAAATAQADLARLDRMVESRDPQAHTELLTGLQRLSPQAFRELAFTFAEQLAALDPEAHRQVSEAMAAQAIAGQRWPEQVALLSRAVEQQDWPAVKFLAATLSSNLPQATATSSSVGVRHAVPLQAPTIPRPPVSTRSTNEWSRDPGATTANEFLTAVNANAERAVQSAVTSKVVELLPDAPEGARQKISAEIFREIDTTLRQDPELLDQVRESVRAALQSESRLSAQPGMAAPPNAAERVAQLIAARARAAMPAVAKRVVADWTETVLRSSRERRTRQSESASRVEVGRGGVPAPVSLRPRGVDYTRMSDEEILNME